MKATRRGFLKMLGIGLAAPVAAAMPFPFYKVPVGKTVEWIEMQEIVEMADGTVLTVTGLTLA